MISQQLGESGLSGSPVLPRCPRVHSLRAAGPQTASFTNGWLWSSHSRFASNLRGAASMFEMPREPLPLQKDPVGRGQNTAGTQMHHPSRRRLPAVCAKCIRSPRPRPRLFRAGEHDILDATEADGD